MPQKDSIVIDEQTREKYHVDQRTNGFCDIIISDN